MAANANIPMILLCFALLVNVVTGTSWVKDLKMTGTYEESYCLADVTCYVHATNSTNSTYRIKWTLTGGPLGITKIEDIPGIYVGNITNTGIDEYSQKISILTCYSRLKFTCRSGLSSKSLTLTLGVSLVKGLTKTENYDGSICAADITCYVQTTSSTNRIEWTFTGGPPGVTNIKDIPGINVGNIIRTGINEYSQSISIHRCYSGLKFTCTSGTSSKSVTLTLSVSLVKSLKMTGTYDGSICAADITCYVQTTSYTNRIEWTFTGGPPGATNIKDIPGINVENIISTGINEYSQRISIHKCYSGLKFTCSSGTSSKSITLTSGEPTDHIRIANTGGLAVVEIVGICSGAILVLGVIAAAIGFARRTKTRGTVVGGGFVNPVHNINPAVGVMQPTVYPRTHQAVPEQSLPPPYHEAK